MSRLGRLYRVTVQDVFIKGSIVMLVVESIEVTDIAGFRIVMGDVVEKCRHAYEAPGRISGPYHYEAMSKLEPLET